jgi:hypothetical protein
MGLVLLSRCGVVGAGCLWRSGDKKRLGLFWLDIVLSNGSSSSSGSHLLLQLLQSTRVLKAADWRKGKAAVGPTHFGSPTLCSNSLVCNRWWNIDFPLILDCRTFRRQ